MSDVRYLMIEHPAWQTLNGEQTRVFTGSKAEKWLVHGRGKDLTMTPIGKTRNPLETDNFSCIPTSLATTAPGFLAPFQKAVLVRRFPNPSLWDAIGTAIVRQVIRASQAKKLYRLFCANYGEQVTLPDGEERGVFPDATETLPLSNEASARTGMTFKRRPLRQAAEEFLEHGAIWEKLPPPDLKLALCQGKGIGNWTAGAAVADYTNDWSLYPYADRAVHIWTARVTPTLHWPSTKNEFATPWEAFCGPHLSSMTSCTLAWGNQHGATS